MALKKKLVYGVGINDVDYVTEKKETVGYAGGSIDFHTYHYNGGGYWTEVVEGVLS